MTHARRRQFGFTLIESAIAASIGVIGLGAVAQNFDKFGQRQHVEGVAAQLETDIHYTRGLAVANAQSVRISFTAADAAHRACYVIHTGNANACRCNAQGRAVCTGTAVATRTVAFESGAPVSVSSNSSSILIDATNGTVTPTATMQVQGRSGSTLKVIVNILGRVRSCAATPGLPGHTMC